MSITKAYSDLKTCIRQIRDEVVQKSDAIDEAIYQRLRPRLPGDLTKYSGTFQALKVMGTLLTLTALYIFFMHLSGTPIPHWFDIALGIKLLGPVMVAVGILGQKMEKRQSLEKLNTVESSRTFN